MVIKDKIKGVPVERLDTARMVQEIADLVQTDFAFDMNCHQPKDDFTQEEAHEMAHLLGRVYSIAHCISCRACQTKFIKL